MPNYEEISYKQEILRKGIHMVSLSIPIGYSFLSQHLTLLIIFPITLLFVVFDILSKKNFKVRNFVHYIFGKMLRPHEISGEFVLNGASWVLLSAILVILVFPKILAVTGFAILIISDICAALFGRKFGKHPLWGKSYEGTSAFIISSYIVIFIIGYFTHAPWTYYLFGLIAGFIGGIAEASSKVIKIDDNLTIPISIGIVMWIGGYISLTFLNTPFLELLVK